MRIRKIISSKRGESLVEVLVAMTIILMCAAAFAKSNSLALNLIKKSVDYQRNAETFFGDFYMGNYTGEPESSGNVSLSYNGGTKFDIRNSCIYSYSDDDGNTAYTVGEYSLMSGN